MPSNCGDIVSPLKYGVRSLIVGILGLGFSCLGYLWAPYGILVWWSRGTPSSLAGHWAVWKGCLLLVIFLAWPVCGPLAVWFGRKSYRVESAKHLAILGIIIGLITIAALACWWVLVVMLVIGVA